MSPGSLRTDADGLGRESDDAPVAESGQVFDRHRWYLVGNLPGLVGVDVDVMVTHIPGSLLAVIIPGDTPQLTTSIRGSEINVYPLNRSIPARASGWRMSGQ